MTVMTGIRSGIAPLMVLASLPVLSVALAPVGHADDGCGPGMFLNTATNQCQYYNWVGPGPVGPGPVGPGPVGPGPVGPGPVGPGPLGPGR